MSVVVVGLNHHTVPLDLLESVAVDSEQLPKALHDLAGRSHLGEVAVLSTCMRTEVYAVADRYHGAVSDIRTFLADWSGHPPEVFTDYVYDFFDEAAVRHLFRVAAGLDSAVLGEGEILRQVKAAWEAAVNEGRARSVLGRLFRHAVETGKRVRTETLIARGSTSLSHTAVTLAGSVGVPLAGMPDAASHCPVVGHGESTGVPPFGPGVPSLAPGSVALRASAGEASGEPCHWAGLLAGRTTLVLGAGEMGEAVAKLITAAPGAGTVLIANRSAQRAASVADRVGGEAVAWEDRRAVLARVDIVMTATSAPGYVLDVADVAAAQPQRSGRPLTIVDLAVPRDVDPAVGELAGVWLFDTTHLKAHAEAALDHRRGEVPRAEEIVAQEVDRHRHLVAERELAPLLTALRQRAEAIRAAEVAKAGSRLSGLDQQQRDTVDAVTRAIVAKLLHEPTANLKASAGEDRQMPLATTAAELFGLETDGGDRPGRTS